MPDKPSRAADKSARIRYSQDLISCYLKIERCYAWSSSPKFGTHTCVKEHCPIIVMEIRADRAPPIGILIDAVISIAHLDAKLTVH